MPYASHITGPDVVLIGSGVMSANLGAMLKVLDPTLSIQVYESTEELAQESSHGWNNAGTGHAGLCELSYTPTREPDGTVTSVRSGLCLDVSGASTANGARVGLWSCHGGGNQQWRLG